MLNPEIMENSNVRIQNESPSIMKITASNGTEMLRFESNGDIFVKGKLTTNDMEVVDGFRELLRLSQRF